MPASKFIRISEVMDRTTLSRSTIYDLMSRDEFPRQTRLTHRVAVWLEADVEQWIKTTAEKGHI